MTEIPQQPVETTVDLTEYGRDLSNMIEEARQRYEGLLSDYAQLPLDVRAELAWKGIASYHSDGVAVRHVHGVGSEADLRMEHIKNQRLAALPDDEARDRAVAVANSWLDGHFSE